MIKQQRFFLNEELNKTNNNSNSENNEINKSIKKQLNISDVTAIINTTSVKPVSDEGSKETETSADASVSSTISTFSTVLNLKKEKPNNKNLWSKITLKFRFVQHFIQRSREKRCQTSNQASSSSSTATTAKDSKSPNSIKLPNRRSRKFSIFDRKSSYTSCGHDLRSRVKSDSEKDSCSYTDDASNDYTISLFEINSNTQLNSPNSIKCASRLNDFLYIVNSDNETIDLFNKFEKSLNTHIDTKLLNNIHEIRTPVDICTTNSNLFVSDWLNDEILVYNSEGQYRTVISNSINNNGIKYFSSPWGISVDYFNDYLYVCNTAKNTIEIFDSNLQHYQTLGRTTSPLASASKTKHSSGSNIEFHTPKWIINCDHWGYAVSDWDANEIKLIDHCSNKVIRTIRDCYSPEGLTLVERTGTQLLVLCSHHKNILKMFDLLSGKLVKTYDMFSGAGDLHYQKYESNSLCSIYGLRGLCYSDEKIYFTDSIKNKIFICNL